MGGDTMTRTRLLFTALILVSGVAVMRSGAQTPVFKTGIDVVSLDVCVRDDSGRFVPDLSAEDFLVLEDGTPQQIAFLVPSNAVPLTAILLIDISHSMHGPKLQRAQEAARQFAELLGPDDRLEMIAFNHRAMRIHACTSPLVAASTEHRSTWATRVSSAPWANSSGLVRSSCPFGAWPVSA